MLFWQHRISSSSSLYCSFLFHNKCIVYTLYNSHKEILTSEGQGLMWWDVSILSASILLLICEPLSFLFIILLGC